MAESDVLRDALAAPEKGRLDTHREAILELRRKSYSWREIAQFLNERGVATDHTKVFRFMAKTKHVGGFMTIPTAAEYKVALTNLDRANKITEKQRLMLESHYREHNRTTTYPKLAKAAREGASSTAHLMYGYLGAHIGEELNFQFVDLSDQNPGTKWLSSAIAMDVPDAFRSGEDLELVMHHELAKALDELGWFPA